jgi:hypothetical protein
MMPVCLAVSCYNSWLASCQHSLLMVPEVCGFNPHALLIGALGTSSNRNIGCILFTVTLCLGPSKLALPDSAVYGKPVGLCNQHFNVSVP